MPNDISLWHSCSKCLMGNLPGKRQFPYSCLALSGSSCICPVGAVLTVHYKCLGIFLVSKVFKNKYHVYYTDLSPIFRRFPCQYYALSKYVSRDWRNESRISIKKRIRLTIYPLYFFPRCLGLSAIWPQTNKGKLKRKKGQRHLSNLQSSFPRVGKKILEGWKRQWDFFGELLLLY